MLRGYSAWWELVRFVWNLFSIGPLSKTLFVPFHQEPYTADKSKSSLGERVIFDLLMRVIGAVARLFIIACGIVTLIFATALLPLFIIFHLPINPDKLNRHRAFGRDLSFRWTPRLRRSAREISHGQEVPLIGKEEVMTRLEQVLSRETQSNVLLVGEPGVGRSTLVSQFAKRVSWGKTPPPIRYKHVFELSLDGLSNNDVRTLLTEAANATNVIVVIDNIHAYIEVFDTLMTFTEIPGFRIIAITDPGRFHSIIKTHSDFLQRFEKIEVNEPTSQDVEALVASTIKAHKVTFEEDVPREIVRLTDRLIMYVPQPEKSLDVVTELLAQSPKHITKEDVEALVSTKTGVPVGKINEGERDVLINLEQVLRESIIGQEEVIDGLAEALRRGRSGVSAQTRPIGSFLFLGPTGVGKTHTAKKLARAYYGVETSMVRFDMSEFSQEESLFEFSKRLVIAIEENPFTLVLFDEIEKSHKVIRNLFLQLLDEARITDASGREAHFHNAFIICTSNAGSEMLIKERDISQENFVSKLLENGTFSPEFLNRFDGVFLYRPLTDTDAKKITELMLREFVDNMKAEKDIAITYGDDLVGALAGQASGSVFGAREIRRTLEHTVASYVADSIIGGTASQGSTLAIPADLVKRSV